jgi:preprotein translocase subunit SecG
LETIILVIHLILAISLVVTVLIQRSEGGGLGMGGGGGGGMMSVRGTANLLTRATAVLAAGFMATSIILAIMSGNTGETRSILDQPGAVTAPAGTTPDKPGTPGVPLSQ